jgi:hypothetical protein
MLAYVSQHGDLGGGLRRHVHLFKPEQTQAGRVRLMRGFLDAPGSHELRILSPVSEKGRPSGHSKPPFARHCMPLGFEVRDGLIVGDSAPVGGDLFE